MNALTPTIGYVGIGINPAGTSAQDFSKPLHYTVMAADSTTLTYVVAVTIISSQKEITSFVFRAADNAGLVSDVKATITNDTISVIFNDSIGVNNLVPFITYTGAKITPGSGIPMDFSDTVGYTVTAQDGTQKTYTVIVYVNHYLYIGSDDGYLYALDASTGTLQWKFATGGAIRSSPTIDNGIIYVGSGDGYLYAINATDGSLKWRYENRTYNTPAVNSSPTVHAGIVYFNAYEQFYALDAMTGTVIWEDNTNDPYGYSGSPTVVDGVVYTATSNGSVAFEALDALTGSTIWQLGGGLGRTGPAVANGIVYGTVEGDILDAADARTGLGRFRYFDNSGSGPGNAPTIANGKVYIGTYLGGLYALDAMTGSLDWEFPASGVSCPTVSDGKVFVCVGEGIYALDANTGAQIWSAPEGFANSNLTVANGVLYFGGSDGSIFALFAATSKLKWSFKTNGAVYSGPCIVDIDGKVFHPTISGDQQ